MTWELLISMILLDCHIGINKKNRMIESFLAKKLFLCANMEIMYNVIGVIV